jgi:8-oxo-dGTP pyrophosphatase MutT (NUDIX family)
MSDRSTQTLTLCFPRDDHFILLGYKKRGFGAGRYNGFGGKVGNSETVREAAIRELQEEAAITAHADALIYRGRVAFDTDSADGKQLVHVFTAPLPQSQPAETEEMRPKWFSIRSLPVNHMWPDDAYWLPEVLRGRRIDAWFHIGADEQTIYDYYIRELN